MIFFGRIYFEVSCRKTWMLSTHQPMWRRYLVQRTYEWHVHVLFVYSHNRCEEVSLCPRAHMRRISMGIEKNSMHFNIYSLMFGVYVYNHRPAIIMHREIDIEQCGVGDSIRHTHKIDIWQCVLLVIPYTFGQAGRFECKFCLVQELVLPIWWWRCASNGESDLGHAHRISVILSLACLRYKKSVHLFEVRVSPLRVSTTTEHQYAAWSFQPVTDMYTLLNHVINFREKYQSRYCTACNQFMCTCNPFFMQRQWHSSDSEFTSSSICTNYDTPNMSILTHSSNTRRHTSPIQIFKPKTNQNVTRVSILKTPTNKVMS